MKWLSVIALLCIAASPPMPPTPRKAPKMVRGMGAADLRIRPKVVVPPANAVLLRWQYPSTPDVWFNVRRFKGTSPERPSTSWPVIATVATNSFRDQIDPQAKLVIYSVTATNIVYGLESSWATK